MYNSYDLVVVRRRQSTSNHPSAKCKSNLYWTLISLYESTPKRTDAFFTSQTLDKVVLVVTVGRMSLQALFQKKSNDYLKQPFCWPQNRENTCHPFSNIDVTHLTNLNDVVYLQFFPTMTLTDGNVNNRFRKEY